MSPLARSSFKVFSGPTFHPPTPRHITRALELVNVCPRGLHLLTVSSQTNRLAAERIFSLRQQRHARIVFPRRVDPFHGSRQRSGLSQTRSLSPHPDCLISGRRQSPFISLSFGGGGRGVMSHSGCIRAVKICSIWEQNVTY